MGAIKWSVHHSYYDDYIIILVTFPRGTWNIHKFIDLLIDGLGYDQGLRDLADKSPKHIKKVKKDQKRVKNRLKSSKNDLVLEVH